MARENIIVLRDECDNPIEFEFIDIIPYDNNEYVVLLPFEDGGYGEQVVILKLEKSGKEELYASVDDDDELMAVYSIFKKKYKNVYNFVD